MRTLDEHVSVALSLVESLPSEPSDLAHALGRTAARDFSARHASPPFDNSAMDGYAVCHRDLRGADPQAPVVLTVAGETAAGAPPAELPQGTAWRIMTGAPTPVGADAVVPVESTDGATGRVAFFAEVAEGAYMRRAGEDARPGDVIVRAGQCFTAARLAALAAVGVGTVDAVRPARVAIIATGDELVDPSAGLAPGQIHDSNTVLLAALVREAGAQPLVMDRVRDQPAALFKVLGSVDADLVVTTGGVSVGAYDVVKEALTDLGVDFAPVAMQPGKPQGLGTVHGTPIACLPGNPVSVLVSFATIVGPMLARLHGAQPAEHERAGPGTHADVVETATVATGWNSARQRRQFMPVRFIAPGVVVPATAGGSGSHLIAALAAAEALADVPAHVDQVAVGDTVAIMRWSR